MNREQRRAWRRDQARRAARTKRHPPPRNNLKEEPDMQLPIESNSLLNQIDSDVYGNGQGYERLVMVSGWDPKDQRRLARVHIRVDRLPSQSYAKIDVWTGERGGWQTLTSWAPHRFWPDLPGYNRAGSAETRRTTRRLADTLLTELVVLAETSDI